MNKLLLLFFMMIFVIISSCSSKEENYPEETKTTITENTKENKSAEELDNYYGTYSGKIPCFKQDCEIEVKIDLIKGNSFIYSTRELGKESEPILTTGSYDFDKTGNIIVLNEIANAPNSFLIEGNLLFQLDQNQQKVQGENADKFILRK